MMGGQAAPKTDGGSSPFGFFIFFAFKKIYLFFIEV